MKLGFETIGNATLICHDEKPILATDPWVQGTAYFGSWALSHEVPIEQREHIARCPYIWLSHGHPDHCHPESLPFFKNAELLLPDHRGGRMRRALEAEGYRVRVLPDREWVRLSPNLRILTSCDANQDAVLLVELGKHLLINTNDAVDFRRDCWIRRLASHYQSAFLFSISGFGQEADMFNFRDENGEFIQPHSSTLERTPIGISMSAKTDRFGAQFCVPFSSTHRYQRTDSDWANRYCPTLEEFSIGYQSDRSRPLPAFLAYDLLGNEFEQIQPALNASPSQTPADFGDDWSEPLRAGDSAKIDEYFQRFDHLRTFLDVVTVRVGGRDHTVKLGEGQQRGVRFEVPRTSLMTSVEYRIFDDLLIGNFMKTTLLGIWPESGLYPDFSPYVTKYGDNGEAYSQSELRAYFQDYERRSYCCPWHRFDSKVTPWLVAHLPKRSPLYAMAKQVYRALR